MKRIFILIIAIISSQILFAQYNPNWVVPAADYFKNGSMAAIDSSNNLIITGYRPAYAGASHIYTRKFDISGNLMWEQIDSSGSQWKFQKPRWVNTDSLNNIYITGYSYSGTSNEYTDSIVVIKYDPNGGLLWRKKIEHIWPGALSMRSALDANGNLFIGTVGINPGFVLIKLDSNGNVLFNVANASSLNQNFNSMRLKNNLVVFTSYAANGSQASVVAFDTAGVFLWSHIFPSRGGMDVEIDDSSNSYILTQQMNVVGPGTNSDIQIYKIDAAGTLLNQYDYDFGGSTDVATRMTLVNNKISVIGWSIQPGFAYMDWIIFQTDLNGNKLWDARYNFTTSNDEKPSWISATENGDVYVSGQGGPDTVGFNGSVYLRYVTAKYSAGTLQWVDADPYQGYIGITNAIDKNCGLYVLGEYAMTAIHYADSCGTISTNSNFITVEKTAFTALPIPTANSVKLKFYLNETGNTTVSVMDVAGHEVKYIKSEKMATGDHEINLEMSEFPSGIYFCRLTTPSTNRLVKIVKL